MFSITFCSAYLVWNENRLFLSSKRASTQHNYLVNKRYRKSKGQSRVATLGTQETRLVLFYISVNKCILSYTTISVSTCMKFKLQITTMSKLFNISVLIIHSINNLNINIYSEFNNYLY